MSLVNGARFLEPSDMISTYFDRSSQSPLYLAVAVQQETTDTDDEALDAPFSKRRKCEVSQHHRFTEGEIIFDFRCIPAVNRTFQNNKET